MTNLIISLLSIALFTVHEMDAVKKHEWRMLIFLRNQKDDTAYAIFNVLHIPLFVIILWGLMSSTVQFRLVFITLLNLFFIIHFFLHLIFLRHSNNEFTSIFSWLIIGGMCLTGISALLLQI